MRHQPKFAVITNDAKLIQEIEDVFRVRIDMALKECGLNLRLDGFNLEADALRNDPQTY